MHTATRPRLADLTADLRQQHAVLDYVRYLSCRQEADAPEGAAALFAQRWPHALHKDLVTKAAVAAGNTTDATWASPLVPALTESFLALLRSASLLGRLPGVRRVPFSVRVPRQTSGGSYYWVGEGALKPVTKFAFDNGVTLLPTKCAGVIVLTRELVRLSTAGAETALRDSLVDGITAFTDAQFLDPMVAAVAGTNPASILNGVTPIATGATLDATVSAVLAALFASRPNATGAVLIVSPGTASKLAGTGNNLDASVSGGSVQGVPLVTTEAAANRVVAIDPTAIVVADAGVEVRVSREATVQLDDAPVGTAAAVVTSLWQTDLAGFLVERAVGWAVAVPGAAQYAVAP